MDIRHFRYFVAVGETLSFTRAARELNIAPQPLSARIAELERELGLRLFDRNTKKVELTAAGNALLPQARKAVREFDATMHRAQSLLPTHSRRLRIAFCPEASHNVLTEVVGRLQQKDIEVCVVDANTVEQQQLLAAGAIDIGVLWNLFEKKGFRISASLEQLTGVVINDEHPLAKVDKLHLHDLSPYPLVLFPRDANPVWYDELLNLCRAGGYIPPRILRSPRPMPASLRTETAVSFTSEQFFKRCTKAETKGVLWRPLENSPIHRRMSVICRSDAWAGITRTAVSVISASLQRHDDWVLCSTPSRSDK